MTGSVTDPVNATKLAAAGALAFGFLGIVIFFNLKSLFLENKLFIALALGFLLSAINAILNSNSPLSQNIYGSYGRNTGFIAYLVLLIISLSALTLRDKSSFKKIVFGLQVAGIVNVIYCAWVLAFGDFLSWNNPYKADRKSVV